MKKVFVTIAVLAQMLFAFSAEAEETPRLRFATPGKRVFLDVDSTREIDGSVEFTIVPMTTPESLGVWAEVRC